MSAVIDDDLKRVVKQLHLIEKRLLDGTLHPLDVRQPLQEILESRNDRKDMCLCGHTRDLHMRDVGRCTHSVTERHHGRIGMRGSTTRPCPCSSFKLASSSEPPDMVADLTDDEIARGL